MATKKTTKKKTMDVVTNPKKKGAKTTTKKTAAAKKTVKVTPKKEVEIKIISEQERYETELNEAFPEEALPEEFPPVKEELTEEAVQEAVEAESIPDREEISEEEAVEVPEEEVYTEEPEPETYKMRQDEPEIDEIEAAEQVLEAEEVAEMKKEKRWGAKKSLKIFSGVLVFLMAVSVGLLIFNFSRSNMLPAKFFYPLSGGLIVVSLVLLSLTLRKKTKTPAHIIMDVIAAIILGVSLFGNLKLNDTINFLNNNLSSDSMQKVVYNVIANKDAEYKELSDIKGETIVAPPDFSVSEDEIKKAAKEQAEAEVEFESDLSAVTKLPLEDKTALILLGESFYESVTEDDKDFKENTKVVGTISVEVKVEGNKGNSNLTDHAFVFYISGIDTRSGTMPYTSLSDVNIAVVVNPTTHKVLLVSIPRDYYVQLHGTTGLHDKLTHAGSLGGVQLSMATIQDLLDIEFEKYIRVNFQFLKGLVDAVGGITVNSDVDYSFTTWNNRSCVINPGLNSLNGDCALAFARERYAYATGDRHRGENQEQVIEKVLEKLTSSTTLITKYSDILTALDGTFETSFTSDDISGLVRYQLDSMPSWKVESQNLDGTTGMTYTYSYPSQPLSVMYEDAESIAAAKKKITEVLNEK